MIAVILLSLLIAIADALDCFTDILAIAIVKINAFQLGLFNALGYVLYIVALYLGGKLSDRGVVRAQVLLISACFVLYSVLLNSVTKTSNIDALIVMYVLYSIAQALSRLSAYTYIHETYPSTSWEKILTRRAVITIICQAIVLTLISSIGITANGLNYFLPFLVIPPFLALLIIKDPPLRIEKTLYVIDVGLKRLERLITNNLAVYALLTEQRLSKWLNLRSLLCTNKYVSSGQILIALVIFRSANALLLVQLPVYLNSVLGYTSNSVLGIYGLARLLLAIDLLISFTALRKMHLVMLVRGLLPLLLLVRGLSTNNIAVALTLGLILYVNSKVDVALYSMYTDALGRVETTRYLLVGEITGFLGTLISGVVYSIVGYSGITIITALMFMLGATLLKA